MTHLTALERIDDAALPYIWVADKPNRDCVLSECSWENCRSSWMSKPSLNEWFGEAWNAIIGYRCVRC